MRQNNTDVSQEKFIFLGRSSSTETQKLSTKFHKSPLNIQLRLYSGPIYTRVKYGH